MRLRTKEDGWFAEADKTEQEEIEFPDSVILPFLHWEVL